MSDWTCFEGVIEAMPWGGAVYTVLRLPREVLDALDPPNPRRVEGEIAGRPVNLAVTRAPVIDDAFVHAGRDLLRRIGVEPGETVEARLRAAPEPRVETPDDLAEALRTAGRMAAWEALSADHRRTRVRYVETARTEVTRAKRIALAVAAMGSQA